MFQGSAQRKGICGAGVMVLALLGNNMSVLNLITAHFCFVFTLSTLRTLVESAQTCFFFVFFVKMFPMSDPFSRGAVKYASN